MPKSKPLPRGTKRRAGRLDAGTVKNDPNGNRAERRAAKKASKQRKAKP